MTNETTQNENEELVTDAEHSQANDVIEEEVLNHQTPKDEDFKAKYYYLAAEIENMRRRFQKEKEDTIKYGSTKILESLVGVLDNFDLTVNAIKTEI